ncbi:hypothetical protein [Thermogutta sp.]|uniref:hypothetical protein n=1 Tax=Thermogutta sp. TaxID=1962930 RepID=UPI003C7B6517
MISHDLRAITRPSLFRLAQGLVLLTGFVLVAVPGCGKSSGVTVSGTVTFDGRPVEEGYLTLSPADGKGPSAGGPIKEGKFSISGVLPGEKIVSVTGGGKMQFPKSSEEMAQMAARGQQIQAAPQIPPNARGNNQKVTITGQAQQTLEISLSSPGS